MVWISSIRRMMPPMALIASTEALVSAWMATNLSRIYSVALALLLGEFLDLVGDDGEALAGLPGASRLDGGV
ncbi:MAG: hypothetical protein ACYDC1_16280 [Limisphaerales bacterium]